MDIHVEMHLSYETDVWAYGMVTLENIIRFPVQLRKFKNKDTGEETSFLSYPRRERCGKWENILVPEKKLREEIEKRFVSSRDRNTFHQPNCSTVSTECESIYMWCCICSIARTYN